MSWDDIDFDFIQSKYITRGSATVSYGDILQQFATAGDERQNLIGENPTITGLIFTAGEIRNTIFWDKYRALISQYRAIMFGFSTGRTSSIYYERGVLTDTTNFSQYAIDFQIVLGIDLYNKIINNGSYSNTELFTAEVLNGLYTIYQNTEIIGNTRLQITGTQAIQNRPVAITNSGDYYESTTTSPFNWVAKPTNTLRANYAFFWNGPDSQSGTISRNKNGIDVILEMRDLDNNILEMDFIGNGFMQRNIIDSGTPPVIPFNTNHALKGTSSNFVNVEWDIVTTSHGATGTTKTINVSEPSPIEAKGSASLQQILIVLERGNLHPIFIDLNNSALEFFIDNS